MATITSDNAAQAIVKLVATEALPILRNALVMGNLVNRDYDSALAQGGNTIDVPLPPSATTANLAEGGTMSDQASAIGNAQVTLQEHRCASFFIPDVTKALVQPDLMKMFLEAGAVALAEKIETDLLGLYPQFLVNAAVGTGAAAITEATVDAAETALFNAKVPQGKVKSLIVTPGVYGTLRQIGRFSEMLTYGNGVPISSGQVLQVKGMNVFRSQLVAKPSTTSYNLAIARDAACLVIRRLGTALPGQGVIQEYVEEGSIGIRATMSYVHGQLGQKFSLDVLYGANGLRPSEAVQVLAN